MHDLVVVVVMHSVSLSSPVTTMRPLGSAISICKMVIQWTLGQRTVCAVPQEKNPSLFSREKVIERSKEFGTMPYVSLRSVSANVLEGRFPAALSVLPRPLFSVETA